MAHPVRILVDDLDFELFIDSDQLHQRIGELADEIEKILDLTEGIPVFLGLLNGSFRFMNDLTAEINRSLEIDFIKVASYVGTQSTGNVSKMIGMKTDLANRHVFIIEDIVDSGHTMRSVKEEILAMNPASMRIVTLVYKPDAFQYDYNLDMVGFEIPNEFIVGYGMDYNGLGRNLSAIYKRPTIKDS